MDFTVEFYEMEDGRQPAREFLLSLDKNMRAKDERVRRLAADIARAVEAHGIPFMRDYWKKLFLNDAGGTDADGRTLCDRLEASLDDARLDAYAKERKAREARGEK